jgi:hypothetical protein
MAGLVTVGAVAIAGGIASSSYHSEAIKLDDLNQILNNPNAKVALGVKKGGKIMKNIKEYLRLKELHGDDDDSEIDSDN